MSIASIDRTDISVATEPLCQGNGVEAQAALQGEEFALVLSDVRMPAMNGAEFLGWLTEHRPDVVGKTIFMTGDRSDSALNADIERARRRLIQKLFALAARLDVALRVLLEGQAG